MTTAHPANVKKATSKQVREVGTHLTKNPTPSKETHNWEKAQNPELFPKEQRVEPPSCTSTFRACSLEMSPQNI